MWEILSAALLRFLQEWGEGAICLIFLLEESGVPMPLPGDLVLIWAGYRISSGQSHLLAVVLLVELPTLIGASVLYWLASKGGRPLLIRFGRFLHLDGAKLARAEGWMCRNATRAIILGRIVPGLRIVTPLAAGAFRVPYRTFLPALAGGALVYSVFWLAVGIFAGPSIIGALEAPRLTARLVLSIVLLIGLTLLTRDIRRRALPGWRAAAFGLGRGRKLEAAALAGLLATLEMATALGILLTAFVQLRLEYPEDVLLRAVALIAFGRGTAIGPAFLPLAAVVFFLAGILWAIGYAAWAEPRLRGPDWLKGATFALLPTGVSLLVVLPLLGAGPLGLGLQAGLVPAAGELVRHLLYGAALGLAYPVLLLARRPWDGRTVLLGPLPQPAT
jgi:membrane protein DedA with SNARE-associated domain